MILRWNLLGLKLEEVGLEEAFWRGVCLYEEFEGSMINILGGSFEGRFEYGGVMEFVLHGGSWKGCWKGLLRGTFLSWRVVGVWRF
jgi:hypothetical protein